MVDFRITWTLRPVREIEETPKQNPKQNTAPTGEYLYIFTIYHTETISLFVPPELVLLDIRAVSSLFGNNECKTTAVVRSLRIECIKQSARAFRISGINRPI